jgi:hypothetical protein
MLERRYQHRCPLPETLRHMRMQRRQRRIVLPRRQCRVEFGLLVVEPSQLLFPCLVDLPRVIGDVANDQAAHVGSELNSRWKTEEGLRDAERRGLEERLDQNWREPFSQFRQLVLIATELGGNQ